MKDLCLAYHDERRFDGPSKSEADAVVSECPPYDASLRSGGHLVAQASLPPVASSITTRPRNGKARATEGPFAGTEEQVGGFFILEARDLNEAIRVASKHPAPLVGEHVAWGIEVRSIGMFEQPQQESMLR